MIGPKDLLELNAPEVIVDKEGVMVERSNGSEGVYYEIVAERQVEVTVADVVAGLQLLPQEALLRDAFGDKQVICINFWRAA
ncbi:hypothetical protein [Acrocarpospora sp. B8E8]|uniref:hypothetical protein n=1 Tax=Acrocarpospora sp. B8E8 TaxID=3153572 RepID=UPI00325F2148